LFVFCYYKAVLFEKGRKKLKNLQLGHSLKLFGGLTIISVLTVVVIITISLRGVFFRKKTIPESANTVAVLTNEDIVNNFINSNQYFLKFYADTFQIEESYLEELLRNRNESSFDEIDIFNTGNEYANKDQAVIGFLMDLEKSNKDLFSTEVTPCTCSKEYMLALIDYFSSIYPDVDAAIAKSIAKVESGYRSSHMLKKNNIFGGMSSKGLIVYRNINYGILRYIKLLNDSYFKKGLTSVEKIGYKYNPTIVDGKKKASPTWVANVNRSLEKYQESTVYSFKELLEMK